MLGTGLFSTPGIIFRYVGGNIPLYLFLWFFGAIIVFSGLIIYLEYALNLPIKNGGEKNYLLRVFKQPKGLSGCIYAFQMVLLGFSSGNSFAFGKYVWFAFTGVEADENSWDAKLLGVGVITFCTWLHIKYPNQGTSLFNFLGVFKILVLVLIIILGAFVALGWIEVPHSQPPAVIKADNSFYSVSVALLEIIYSFKGWENANYVLLEIDDPYHVLTIAAPAAVLLVTVLYFLVILSYLVVIPKHELLNSGVLVAGIFFNKIFGDSITSKVLPLLIASSTLGNVMVVSFAHLYVNQELAKNNYIPFSKYFSNINHSLLLHWAISVFILVAPPSSEIYEFVVNLYIYPGTWINLAITIGLIYLRLNKKSEHWGEFNYSFNFGTRDAETFKDNISLVDESEPTADDSQDEAYTEFDSLLSLENQSGVHDSNQIISAPLFCIVLFLIANLFLALFPFVPPSNPSATSIPYWCFPVVGTGVLALGVVFFFARSWFNNYQYTKYGIGEPEVRYEE